MVDLPSGKMKSREGTVVDADELMDEMMATARERTEELGKFDAMSEDERERLYAMLGVGAIKYFLLRVDPKKRMLFNPAESIDLQGNTATAIQYVHARISSVLRKAEDAGYTIDPTLPATEPELEADERELIVALVGYGATIQKAAADMAPSHIANYCYEVSRLYNKFFATCSILQAPTEARRSFRLALCQVTGRVLKHGMGLLGIEVPERM
jgi:arginyl-tRNA synthetase